MKTVTYLVSYSTYYGWIDGEGRPKLKVPEELLLNEASAAYLASLDCGVVGFESGTTGVFWVDVLVDRADDFVLTMATRFRESGMGLRVIPFRSGFPAVYEGRLLQRYGSDWIDWPGMIL